MKEDARQPMHPDAKTIYRKYRRMLNYHLCTHTCNHYSNFLATKPEKYAIFEIMQYYVL